MHSMVLKQVQYFYLQMKNPFGHYFQVQYAVLSVDTAQLGSSYSFICKIAHRYEKAKKG